MTSIRRAFTLIELLVVIAIIAILAAILFPVFAQAKLAAKQSAGLSGEKQIGTGVLIYSADNDDRFVPYMWFPDGDYNTNNFTPAWHTWMNQVNPYVKNTQIWIDNAFSYKVSDAGYSSPTYKVVSTYIWPAWLPYSYWTWFDSQAKMAGYPVYQNTVSSKLSSIDAYVSTYGAQALDMNSVNNPADASWLVHGYYISNMTTTGADKDFGDAWTLGFSVYDGTDPAHAKDPNFSKINPYHNGENVGYTDSHAKYINTKKYHYDTSTTRPDGRKVDSFMRTGD